MSAASEEVARISRRLERERAARQEAEAIAERGTRELWEQKRRLCLLETVAGAANSSRSLDEAMHVAIAAICEYTHWPVGHAFLPLDRDGTLVLVSGRIWSLSDDGAFEVFRKASEAVTLSPGVGLPGRVFATRKAAWSEDVTIDANFPRAASAEVSGLRAGFALPIRVSGQVAAVLEFFSRVAVAPDESLLNTLEQVGAQLGQVIERDLTDQRMRRHNLDLEALIAEAKAQSEAAEAANLAKSAFLAVTSHEIRTPLNAVLGLAEALKREELNPRQSGLVQGVIDSGAMLLRLLNAVLDLSKIEAGKMTVEMGAFDLRRTLATLVDMWRPRAEELGVELCADLVGLPVACRMVTDVGKIEQALINLISNAIKFSPAGGRVLVRATAVRGEGDWTARVEVHDQGEGVPESERELIFKPFEQTKLGRDAGGAGLGLSICAGNLALLDGAIGCDELPGGGGLFWFAFPAGLAGADVDEVTDPVIPALSVEGLRILAAEDNPANRRVLEALLAPAGVAVTFVEDGQAAVAAAAALPFDLILMDANMPRMNGVEAVRAVRGMGGSATILPIYMLTANVFDEDIARYHAAGVNGVLKKPIEVRELYATLASAARGAVAAAAA